MTLELTLATGAEQTHVITRHNHQGPSRFPRAQWVSEYHWGTWHVSSLNMRSRIYLFLGPPGLLDDKFGDVGGLGISHDVRVGR